MQKLPDLLSSHTRILMECAIVERLRRAKNVVLHESLVNAPLIYQQDSREQMANIYREYMAVAKAAGLPFLMCSPTWRCNRERVDASLGSEKPGKITIPETINEEAVEFLQMLRSEQAHERENFVCIGGMLGCRNDCYLPAQALGAKQAEDFHAWQIERLAHGGVDFLIAETLPETFEALGIARAMEKAGMPYVISFVIGRNGRILDGRSLTEAMDIIDAGTNSAPLGYMVNCAHPDFLRVENESPRTLSRLMGFLANASDLSHTELEAADNLQVGDLDHWGRSMNRLNTEFGIKIVGGCCGTDRRHLELLCGQPGAKIAL